MPEKITHSALHDLFDALREDFRFADGRWYYRLGVWWRPARAGSLVRALRARGMDAATAARIEERARSEPCMKARVEQLADMADIEAALFADPFGRDATDYAPLFRGRRRK